MSYFINEWLLITGEGPGRAYSGPFPFLGVNVQDAACQFRPLLHSRQAQARSDLLA